MRQRDKLKHRALTEGSVAEEDDGQLPVATQEDANHGVREVTSTITDTNTDTAQVSE